MNQKVIKQGVISNHRMFSRAVASVKKTILLSDFNIVRNRKTKVCLSLKVLLSGVMMFVFGKRSWIYLIQKLITNK